MVKIFQNMLYMQQPWKMLQGWWSVQKWPLTNTKQLNLKQLKEMKQLN